MFLLEDKVLTMIVFQKKNLTFSAEPRFYRYPRQYTEVVSLNLMNHAVGNPPAKCNRREEGMNNVRCLEHHEMNGVMRQNNSE